MQQTEIYKRPLLGSAFGGGGRQFLRHSVRNGSLGRKSNIPLTPAFRRNATGAIAVASLRDAGLGRVVAVSTERFIPNGMKNGVKTTANFQKSGDFVPENENGIWHKNTVLIHKYRNFVPKMGSKQLLISIKAVILYPKMKSKWHKTTANSNKSRNFVPKKRMNDLINIFNENSGFLKSKDIISRTQWRNLAKMLNENLVYKVKRGLYRLSDYDADQLTDVSNIIPDGVLCLFSAWFHYELTTTIPHSYYIAIEKKRKIVLPDYPPIKLHYWQKNQYDLGISTYTKDGIVIKIYDIEKSVCDAVKFRNKTGIDIAAEVLKNYLHRQDRNLTKLVSYARQLRIEKILRTYLEVEL
ncbi:hypothetical protein SAMD00024442_1_8 [Candidatus Symbiothrix dinenymphae]|nr:hypothetical protein SAMD00024442_1_8 [Candidatus Symbiothrix dinenymphae]